jgi:hypothetical protein
MAIVCHFVPHELSKDFFIRCLTAIKFYMIYLFLGLNLRPVFLYSIKSKYNKKSAISTENKGMVIISDYENNINNECLKGW